MTKIFTAFIAVFLMFNTAHAQDVSIMSPEDAYKQTTQGELTLIDVRRPAEWENTGIAEPALPMTMHGPDGVDGLVQDILAHVKGDKSRPVAVICRSGTRSAKVAKALKDAGFSSIFDVSEGMEGDFLKQGWLKRGLPTKAYSGG